MEKASIINYFDVLGIKKCFEIDIEELEKRYTSLQKTFHPDILNKGALSNVELEFYLEKVSCINKAYSCIKDPISRAKHLIELKGFDEKNDVPCDYLEQILDLQEKTKGANIKEIIYKLYNNHFKNMKDAFRENNYEKAHLNFLLLKYILRLKERLDGSQN